MPFIIQNFTSTRANANNKHFCWITRTARNQLGENTTYGGRHRGIDRHAKKTISSGCLRVQGSHITALFIWWSSASPVSPFEKCSTGWPDRKSVRHHTLIWHAEEADEAINRPSGETLRQSTGSRDKTNQNWRINSSSINLIIQQ